jgi:hypothetical protein|tara:strand:+ start:680 stop:826 length:147 start_codon:yes stop_codon:yes gene_type:complete
MDIESPIINTLGKADSAGGSAAKSAGHEMVVINSDVINNLFIFDIFAL